ncbi:MAG: hypothetical protein A2087_13055 [Spirochaetes bacterium GWD1_61_31]|nr:MAG: hypothetical protein A2Y37_02460 [Spirochaetes bacterium GWB1_60_80]OHD28571.1 MAG: hypothetical protein A2004_03035 [Spirochaetes bacterium GWC1_61_12]OHD39426.1 MAG: hypothetical protein A2087_13055 [Spirochaetes bacterium GWD1_61_31]OHD45481.1 MAG: hypothetical protein A2Y35_02730 [Spirochaetes bacterium GWE1_60_18]OHD58053.1 MAG: hypothetical protein A2Y32_05305 [Spirochaetes bacterium GWF1_60_12]HAP44618.1 hypothetical protein [Spirochaetaceae bacterium]
MPTLYYILSFLSFAVNAYLILCVVRIFLTWVPGLTPNPATAFIIALTDPFLNLFRGIKFLRSGNMDFSSLAAFAVLAALSRGLIMAGSGQLTLGSSLLIILEMIISPISFLLSFFALLFLARLLAYLFKWNSLHPVWLAIDALINPLLFRLKRFFFRNRIVHYQFGLIVGLLVLGGLRVVLSVLLLLLNSAIRGLLG